MRVRAHGIVCAACGSQSPAELRLLSSRSQARRRHDRGLAATAAATAAAAAAVVVEAPVSVSVGLATGATANAMMVAEVAGERRGVAVWC